MNGTVHVIPNGEIRLTSNLTRDYASINIDFRLPLDVDLKRACDVIDEIGKAISHDQAFESKIRIAPHFLRVEDVTDSAVLVKIVGEVAAGAQWEVSGELRKQLIEKLNMAGVGPAYPRRVVFQEEQKSTRKSSSKTKKQAS
jgi:small conductance mechanosensitive channel